jgi:DNA-binding LacI/PurR family transcriptional regulator
MDLIGVPSDLRSIRIDKFLLGSEAVRTLVSMTHSPEAAAGLKKVIRPTLIVRESTGTTSLAAEAHR